MGTVVAIQLNDRPEVRELLQVLKGNGLEKEYQEVETLISYLDGMEARFGQVLSELQEINKQLPFVQDNTIKDNMAKIVHSSENTVQKIGNKFQEAKENVIKHAKSALQFFKNLGIKALQKAVTAMKIPELLQGFEQTFHNGMESAEHNAERINAAKTELHAIGVHTQNLGGILHGKEFQPKEAGSVPDKGILFKIEKAFHSIAKGYSVMERATADIRNRLEQFLDKGKEEKPSVRAELSRLKSESEKTAVEKAVPQKDMETSVQEKHKADVER